MHYAERTILLDAAASAFALICVVGLFHLVSSNMSCGPVAFPTKKYTETNSP